MTTDSIRYTYFNSTNSIFETIGTAAGNEVTHYVNTVTNYNLPFALNNNFTDLFYSSLYYSGAAPTIVTGSNNTFCNTMGNLSLGNVVYNNVYKVRANQTIIYDYYNGIYTTTQTVNRFSWYDGITKFPLLEYEHIRTVNNYDPIGTFHINAIIKVREGLLTNKIEVNREKVNIINTENKILIKGNLKVLSIELLSLNGQLAKFVKYTSVLETENIKPGIYIVKVVHENGIEYKKINIQ